MKNDFDKCRLEERNDKIIRAVIEKAERVCPGSLAMVGIYGSFMTGDIHEKSDLDLLILINDEAGFQLATGFLQDDLRVGHDIYCTTWERLEDDAKFEHPHLSKLMDSDIVWCADETHREHLESLRQSVRERITAPMSQEDFARAKKLLAEAERYYAKAMYADTLAGCRERAAEILYYLPDALMLLNKRYYLRGTRRLYEELRTLPKRPLRLCEMMDTVVSVDTPDGIKSALTALLRKTEEIFEAAETELTAEKEAPSPDNLGGTYEEMFSNWRNKMVLAAETGNRLLAFSTLGSLQAMLDDIAGNVDIGRYDAMSGYNPDNLWKTAEFFDRTVAAYLAEYEKAGLNIRRYADIDEFVKDYLNK
ncbi:MAG: nucleotidyltransferase domain-containing protein [Clostridia bacterium]|nr:nucleotidyltransferase domain-containing protein [Clostridia bacterium]